MRCIRPFSRTVPRQSAMSLEEPAQFALDWRQRCDQVADALVGRGGTQARLRRQRRAMSPVVVGIWGRGVEQAINGICEERRGCH